MKWWVNGADMLQPGGPSAIRDIRYWRMSRPGIWMRRTAKSVMDLLQELHQGGATIVVVTHSAEMTRGRSGK